MLYISSLQFIDFLEQVQFADPKAQNGGGYTSDSDAGSESGKIRLPFDNEVHEVNKGVVAKVHEHIFKIIYTLRVLKIHTFRRVMRTKYCDFAIAIE